MSENSDLIRSMESALGVSLSSETAVVVVTTSFAVLIGLLFFIWKRSSDRSKEVRPIVVAKPFNVEDEDDELEVGSGKVRVTVFYGTQTGTAEGFAKVIDLCFCFLVFLI